MKAEIKKKEISPDLEKNILKLSKSAAKNCKTDKEKAEFLKIELDEVNGGPWNVIVGKKFGGVVTYIPDHFIYFSIKGTDHLIYSTRNMKGKQ
nr:dynein light chain 1, cytoplasmic-like [Ciona intestinalis]|eukprot:XP_026693789.1 dynein light chain 1, cytoplasmic-like [Ciona intestinalis]